MLIDEVHYTDSRKLFFDLLDYNSDDFVFRGLGCSTRDLSPSIARAPILEPDYARNKDNMELFKEFNYLELFIAGCDYSGERVAGDSFELRAFFKDHSIKNRFGYKVSVFNDKKLWPLSCPGMIDLMAQAQHHGVPTRLLDWTRIPAIACYFGAIQFLEIFSNIGSKSFNNNQRISIFIMNKNSPYFNNDNVKVQVSPGFTSKNIAAQNGVFSFVRGADLRGLDLCKLANAGQFLKKITLPVSEVPSLLEYCKKVGVSSATMFPGYEGAAKYAKDTIAKSNFTTSYISKGNPF